MSGLVSHRIRRRRLPAPLFSYRHCIIISCTRTRTRTTCIDIPRGCQSAFGRVRQGGIGVGTRRLVQLSLAHTGNMRCGYCWSCRPCRRLADHFDGFRFQIAGVFVAGCFRRFINVVLSDVRVPSPVRSAGVGWKINCFGDPLSLSLEMART